MLSASRTILEKAMNRRDFLKTTGAVSAAWSIASAAEPAASGMFIALNTSLVGGKVQWPEFARLAARVGYQGTDLNLGAAEKEGQDATRALLTELKLRISFTGLPANPTHADDAVFEKEMAAFESHVKFAAAVGCTRMMVVIPPASQTPKEELRKTLMRRFQTMRPVLEKHRVRCAFEFLGPLQFRQGLPYPFIWQMHEMVEFAKECGPTFGVVLDVWHWYHSGSTLDDIRDAGKSRIVLVHLSDAARMPPEDVRDNQRLLAGEGVIDLIGIFKTLKQIGWEGSVSPEPLGRIPKEMSAEEGARLGLESARAILRKAGIEV
jgi:sugar phosphate isomerase/epimerase